MPATNPKLECGKGRTLGREAGDTLLAGLAVTAFCLLLLAYDARFFWHDDFQSYFLPAYCDVARAWSEGELPLLSPAAGRGAAIAAEYQAGVFSAFLTLCVVGAFSLGLSLPGVAAVLFIVHAAVLAMGAQRLARRLGLASDMALFVALTASLNGYLFVWGKVWVGPIVSFAWVPWLWWSLYLAVDGGSRPARIIPAAVCVYLIVTAGWPFSVLMSAVLSGWFVLQQRAAGRGLRESAPSVAAAWLVGLALAAPAWLMMLEYYQASARGEWPLLYYDPTYAVPVLGLLGLAFPALVYPWSVAGTVKLHQCIELTGGIVPLALLLAALANGGRSFLWRRRWEWFLLGFLLEMLLLPLAFSSFRWAFRWLPLFFLVLGVLAAHALADLRAGPLASATANGRPNLGVRAGIVLITGWLAAELLGLDPSAQTTKLGVALTGATLLWALVEWPRQPFSWLRTWAPGGLVPLLAWPMYAGAWRFMEVPQWPLDEAIRSAAPLDPARRYWSVYTYPDIVYWDDDRATHGQQGKGAGLRFGLTCLYSRVEFFHGYTAMGPPGLTRIYELGYHGSMSEEGARRLLTWDTGPQGFLELLSVDGLVVSNSLRRHCTHLEGEGWRQTAVLPEGVVYHRRGSASTRVRALEKVERGGDPEALLRRLRERDGATVPLLLPGESNSGEPAAIRFASARVTPIRESRCRVEVEVAPNAADKEILVVFARQWFPGYRATLQGAPVPVEPLNLTLPAARLPAGSGGRLVLEYRPRGLVVGGWLAGGALVGVVLLGGWSLTRRG